MLKDSYTTKKKASLLPDRRNKYSIRKFTVGTASILVGATLLFGVGTHDAKAAEQSTTSTENAVTPNKDTKVEVNHADAVVNETAKPTSPEVVQKDVAKAEDAASKQQVESPEKAAPKAEAVASKQQVESPEKAAPKAEAVASKQQVESSEKAAPKAEDVTPKQQDASTEKVPVENKADVKQAVEQPKVKLSQPTLEIQQVKDLKTAAEFYAQSSGVSMNDAQALIKNLNLDSQATPKEIQQALINRLSSENKKWLKPAVRKDLTTEAERAANASDFVKNVTTLPNDPEAIVADAIANGYISSTTDATNAKNTLSGRAWVVDKGTPATMSNGLTPVPQGTNVYMQWIDKDGAVSPVYTAKTTNELSKSGGSQVGPGAYAFDLREGWVDLSGTRHKYDASAGQDYRLWIDDYQTKDGNKVTMLRQAGGFFPGTFVDSVTYSNLGQFPLIGTNMQRTGIFMAVIPTGGYMEKAKADQIHDTAGPINAPAVNLSAKNTVSGKVWLETGAGDYANSATGPNDNEADPQAEGYTVVMSSLTPEGAKAYDEAVNSLPENERADATKTLLEEHPDYISATVYGETDKDGRYTLRFPEGTLDTNHLYGYVKKPSGNIINTYSSFTTPQFRAANANLSWTPQTAPAQNLVANPMWYNVNFAAIPTADITIDILNYNTTTTPAVPGSNVDIELPGTTMSPLPTHIEWRDEKGNVLVKTPEFKTTEEGEKLGKFQVPTDAKSGDIYTAYLVTGGNDVSADSLIVQTYAEVYEPIAQPIEKPYGQSTTEQEVKDKVTVPNFPADKGTPVVTVDDPAKVPNGQTSGTFDVPVTVTYPDGSKDKATVKVTVDSKDSDVYEPLVQPIEKPYGTPTTVDEVKGKVSVPNFPTDKGTPEVTVDDSTKVPNGQTSGVFNVPVTVTYPDGTKDNVTVKVTVDPKDSDVYEPVVQPIEKPYGTPTTVDEVKGKVSVPNFPTDKGTPEVTVDDSTKVPNGQTSGVFNVPVTVTYPDGTKDNVIVKVTVGPKDSDVYEPVVQPIEKPYGQGTTEQEIKDTVTVPNFPADKGTPVVTVDDPTKVPNGQTSGTFDVPVTVTYPDGTKDKATVKVTVGNQPDNVKYEPQAGEITKSYGQPTTVDEVKGKVTVPGYPGNGQPYTVTVDETKIPDGQTSGVFEVPVTVTYPDKTVDTVNVKVTVGSKDSDIYEPKFENITKPFGTPTTVDEVKDTVTVPNFPANKGTPVVSVDDPTKIPNGQTQGVFDVPVTVTYPDGTKDHVTVKVTVGNQPDNVKYEPQAGEITKAYGQPTTADEVKGKVTVPGYPDSGQPYTVKVDEAKIPDGQTSGAFEVPATVTYPDKTTDTVNVKVTVDPKDSDVYEPVVQPIEKPYGQGTTEQEIKDKVTVPNFPADKGTPVVTVDDPAKVPNGQTSGTFEVPVTVTYPDGTKDHVTVKVTVGNQPDNVKYEPQAGELTKSYGQPTTADEVRGKVTVPGYPENGQPYTITVDDTKLPNGQTSGEFEVPVTVTYPDKTTDTVNVKVTVDPKDSDTYEPTAQPIEKTYGTPTTVDDVLGSVKVPGYPENGKPYTVTVNNPSALPNGQTPGNYEVPVTVTYPDGTKDHIKVTITVHPQFDSDVYNPGYNNVTVNPGKSIEIPQVKDKVPTGTHFEIPKDSGVDKDWKVTVAPDTGTITITAPKDAVEGHVVKVPVTVTYPDGTKDHVTANVTVHDSIAPDAPVVNPVEVGNKTVTGTGKEPDTTVTVTFPGGSVASTKVGKDGKWKVEVPSTVKLKVGDTVKAVITDEAGNVSKETVTTVKETVASSAPIVNGIHTGDKENSPTPNEENTNVSTGYTTNHTDTNKQSTQSEVAKVKATSSTKAAKKAQSTAKALPDTGEDTPNSGTLFGGLFATLGAFLLFRRRHTHDDNK